MNGSGISFSGDVNMGFESSALHSTKEALSVILCPCRDSRCRTTPLLIRAMATLCFQNFQHDLHHLMAAWLSVRRGYSNIDGTKLDGKCVEILINYQSYRYTSN